MSSGGDGEPRKPGVRRVKLRFAAAARWLHIYTSVLGLAAVLFFSVTGITLNHPDWMFGGVQRRHDYRGQLQTEWLGSTVSGQQKPCNQLRIVEFLRREHGLHGAVDEFREEETEGTVGFKGPGYSADVFFDRATGKYEVTELSEGLVAVLNDLHKGRHTGTAWSLVIDITAVLLVIISASGLALLLFIRRRRVPGAIIALLGAAAVALVAWLLVP